MITDKENQSRTWLKEEIFKIHKINPIEASVIVNLCFEEFKANVENFNQAAQTELDEANEEIETLKEKLETIRGLINA